MISLDQYHSLHHTAGYLRRDDRGRLILRGDDRLTYLHGLLTNDIASLHPGTGCYAALLTPQGRMIADMRVCELHGGMVLIDLDRSLVAPIRDHLERFVITEDVAIEDATGRLEQIGIYGPTAAHAIARALLPDMDVREHALSVELLNAMQSYETRHVDFEGGPLHVISTEDVGIRGFDLIVAVEHAERIERAIEGNAAALVSRDVLEVTRIEAGIPKFLVDMDTTTIPLEAGIEGRAISMTKGCYVGQEVIIRVLHRGGGRVAKRLVGLVTTELVERDDLVFSGDHEAGRITSATDSPRLNRPIALGYVLRDRAVQGTELVVRSGAREVPARVVPLPFGGD